MDLVLKTSPIRVGHIAQIQEMLGINTTDLAWLLGTPPGRWSSISRDVRLAPDRLVDPSYALLLRWMMQHPKASPSLHAPVAGEFLVRLRAAIGGLTAKTFALNLGWDATAGSRWLRTGSPIGPDGRRALSLLDSRDPDRLAGNWLDWAANAVLEARLRGIDLSRSLGWTRGRTNPMEAIA